MGGEEEGGLGCQCVIQAKKTNKQTPTSPSGHFLPLQSPVIDVNSSPNGPARRVSNLQMTAFAGTTSHGALQSNAEGPRSLKDLG